MIFSCHHQGLHGRHAQTQQVLQFALSFIIQLTTRVLRLAQHNHTQHGTNKLPVNGDDDPKPEDRKAGSDSPEKKRIGIRSSSFFYQIMRVENNNAVRS